MQSTLTRLTSRILRPSASYARGVDVTVLSRTRTRSPSRSRRTHRSRHTSAQLAPWCDILNEVSVCLLRLLPLTCILMHALACLLAHPATVSIVWRELRAGHHVVRMLVCMYFACEYYLVLPVNQARPFLVRALPSTMPDDHHRAHHRAHHLAPGHQDAGAGLRP